MLMASFVVLSCGWPGQVRNIPLAGWRETRIRTVSWVAMMFAAGMGIGLMFYGVAEPLYHYSLRPAPGTDGPPSHPTAMATSIFHWTLHPWAMYAVVASHGYAPTAWPPATISVAFTSLFGVKTVEGPIGKFINVWPFSPLCLVPLHRWAWPLQIGSA